MLLAIAAALIVMALGGAAFAFAGDNAPSQKRMAALKKPQIAGRAARSDASGQRRKNVQATLKVLEAKQLAQKKEKLTIRRRLQMAGFDNVTPLMFWLVSSGFGSVVGLVLIIMHQSMLVSALASFGMGFGLPRWVLAFLNKRREKAFTAEFANGIDVIVRSVKSGLPTNEALKIVAKEIPDPVGFEFTRLCEGLRLGVTLEEGLKKMYESMPTAEVSFFSIVMTIQQKSGGNLSEALSNLSGVLRDRKRLSGKIKAMSSEAKASAMIIGSLPPGVMGIVYVTTPAYISLLFTERLGNLMLAGCAVWMGLGIFVMRQMINFKH